MEVWVFATLTPAKADRWQLIMEHNFRRLPGKYMHVASRNGSSITSAAGTLASYTMAAALLVYSLHHFHDLPVLALYA